MEVPIIQKPVHWFVLQTNGLVSISLGPPSRNGSMVMMMMMMMMLMTIVMIVVVWDGSTAKTRNYGKAAKLCFWLFLLNYCIVNVSFHELLINDNFIKVKSKRFYFTKQVFLEQSKKMISPLIFIFRNFFGYWRKPTGYRIPSIHCSNSVLIKQILFFSSISATYSRLFIIILNCWYISIHVHKD